SFSLPPHFNLIATIRELDCKNATIQYIDIIDKCYVCFFIATKSPPRCPVIATRSTNSDTILKG
ncbi:MAG: hypothetical protein PVH35_09710, partial [Syntrophobacterales bacterium]